MDEPLTVEQFTYIAAAILLLDPAEAVHVVGSKASLCRSPKRLPRSSPTGRPVFHTVGSGARRR